MHQFTESVHPIGNGTQRVYRFPNGYGASVVRFKLGGRNVTYGSYTSDESEWEVAVIKFTGEEDCYDLCYDTPIASDVIGHVSDGEELESLLTRISELEPCGVQA